MDADDEVMPSRFGVRLRGDALIQDYVKKGLRNTELLREDVPSELGLRYGDHPRETMDVYGYGAVRDDAPVLVFFHGGYWVHGDKEMVGFVARPFTESGIAVAVAKYPLAPEVTLGEMVASARRCVAHVLAMATRKKSRGVFVSGHSAGAHLAIMALCDGSSSWTAGSAIRGALLFSGVYDVRPLLNTSVAKDAAITAEHATANSPVTLVHRLPKKLMVQVIVAEHDPPQFHLQARDFHSALRLCGVKSEISVFAGEDHFTFFDKLVDKSDQITSHLINAMLAETMEE